MIVLIVKCFCLHPYLCLYIMVNLLRKDHIVDKQFFKQFGYCWDNVLPDLKTGVLFAILNSCGKISDWKDRLKMWERGPDISRMGADISWKELIFHEHDEGELIFPLELFRYPIIIISFICFSIFEVFMRSSDATGVK